MSEDLPREPDALAGVAAPEAQRQLVGHSRTAAGILEQLERRRLPNAVLLHGPRGIGKATLAFAVARDILMRTGDEGSERVHEQVAASSHPNLSLLRRQPKDGKGFYSVIRVDEIRALRERLQHTRGRAGHRIAIVDSIDDCNPSAANALLKILEEPPVETLFFLISHRPGSLLPTIRSRCQSLPLRPLPDGDVRDVLVANAAGTDAVLDRAVSMAGGRPRRGLEVLLLGSAVALGALEEWLQAPLTKPVREHLELADLLARDADGAQAALAREMILSFMAGEARAAALGGDRRLLASANALWDKAAALLEDADTLNLDMRQTLVTIFDAIRYHLGTTAAPAVV